VPFKRRVALLVLESHHHRLRRMCFEPVYEDGQDIPAELQMPIGFVVHWYLAMIEDELVVDVQKANIHLADAAVQLRAKRLLLARRVKLHNAIEVKILEYAVSGVRQQIPYSLVA